MSALTIRRLLIAALLATTVVPVGISPVAAAPGSTAGDPPEQPGWPSAGQDVQDTHSAPREQDIGPRTVANLTTRWADVTTGDVAGTPTEAGGTVYVTDLGAAPGFAGRLWAIRARTGAVEWSHAIGDYTGFAGDGSRTSPAVSGDELVIGDWTLFGPSPVGANIIAVDRASGQRIWQTQVDSHPASKITGSPVVAGGTVYVGVSSNEESFATAPGYVCCTFRGSVVALDARTGQIRWRTDTVPPGYSGGAVWGSTPAVNLRNGLVYVGTGNNYSVPPGVCSSPSQTGCTPPAADDHDDSVLALDAATGAVRWAKPTLTHDVWTVVCGFQPSPTCGPDFDFGSGPNLLTLPSGRQLLGIGQKSGVYWALDPLSGAEVWHTQVGPGGFTGGIEWGSATDGRQVYAAIADSLRQPYQITSASGQTTTISGGSWAALDAATGRIRWQTADPQGAMDLGFLSVANGVVYGGSTAATGADMYALDAATGTIRWSFASGGSVVSGAAIVDGTVYWGSGYYIASACPGATSTTQMCAAENNRLNAFSLPNDRDGG